MDKKEEVKDGNSFGFEVALESLLNRYLFRNRTIEDMDLEERKLAKKLLAFAELEEDFSVIEWIDDNICETVEECKDKLNYYYENNNRFGFDLALLKYDFYFFEDRETSVCDAPY